MGDLVLLALLVLATVLQGFGANLLVVLLEGSKVLTGLGELAFLHTLTDVPVNERTLGVHEVELVVETGQHLRDGGGVGDHAHGAHDLGEVAARDDSRGLVVDANLEATRGPVDELDGALGLDGGNGSVNVLRDNVTAVQQSAGHVLAVARVALGHHGGWLEDGVGQLSNGELLVVRLLRGDDRRVRGHAEVDTRVRDEVSLELSDINVQGTVETQGRGERRDGLRDEAVEVGVGGSLDVQRAAADVVQGLVVERDGDVAVLEQGVRAEDRVVRLDDSGGDLGGRVDGEAELGLLAVVDRQALEKQRGEARASATTSGVEAEEALQASAVVCELADTVEDQVNNLLADGVVATREVVRGVLLAGDQLLRVEELAVGARADFVNDGRLEVHHDGAGHVLASAGLGEEGVEGVVAATDGLVRRHLAVRLDAVLEAVELPAGVTGLDTGLAHVKRDGFAHCEEFVECRGV